MQQDTQDQHSLGPHRLQRLRTPDLGSKNEAKKRADVRGRMSCSPRLRGGQDHPRLTRQKRTGICCPQYETCFWNPKN
jgi:hypothetical protein